MTDNLKQDLDKLNSAWNLPSDKQTGKSKPFANFLLGKKSISRVFRWYLSETINKIIEFNSYAVKVLNKTIDSINIQNVNINNQNVNINNQNVNINNKIADLDKSLKRVELRTRDLSKKETVKTSLQSTNSPEIQIDYFMFENKFRGDSSFIKDNQKIYIPYFANKENVLDIGCGRGEFLENLIENNIKAIGIDLDKDMVITCKEKGLNVIKTDAISFLNSIDDNSLGGIFLGQVVEHLTPHQLISLIRLCYQKLGPTSYFIAETINPLCLSTFSKSFILDLSHQKLIHPQTIEFILNSEGFSDIEIKFLSPMSENERLHLIDPINADSEDNPTKQMNNNIQKLNNLLFGYQDYAVIAKKEV